MSMADIVDKALQSVHRQIQRSTESEGDLGTSNDDKNSDGGCYFLDPLLEQLQLTKRGDR